MLNNKFVVSHAPFFHNGSSISERSYHILLSALFTIIHGLIRYGAPAVGVVAISISSAIIWEFFFNKVAKQKITIGDGNAAMIGTIFAMLIPATLPWWAVITGTGLSVILGKQIFGGIGGNPFNPTILGLAIVMISWKNYFDFDTALVDYDFDFKMLYPISALKHFGVTVVEDFPISDLIIGKQIGGIGTTCGILLILGGLYLIVRGFIRWEISVSFIAGISITALIFNVLDPEKFAGPLFHIFTGYTLVATFFLLTEDSSSPVNLIPMIIYGAGCGVMTILIRNIGAYSDGIVLSILLMNLVNPLIDRIRPKARGKVKVK